jgi:hypothetical protein
MAQHCLRCCRDRHSLRDGPLKTADAIAMKLGINKTAMSGCVLVSVWRGYMSLVFPASRRVWTAAECSKQASPDLRPGARSNPTSALNLSINLALVENCCKSATSAEQIRKSSLLRCLLSFPSLLGGLILSSR